jgi:Restriction Endonuclease associating with ARP
MPPRSPLGACRAALIAGLGRSNVHAVVDAKGYVSKATDNLIEGVNLADFEVDLRQGDGNEMEGKFRAAHSSSALAVNTFARFKSDVATLRLPHGERFTSLCFERKCHHGLAGRRSPNLDVLAENPGEVLAIESKCLEPLSRHRAKFAAAYDAGIRDTRRSSAWFHEMQRLAKEPEQYRWVDAAQLVKHAFGLAYTFPDKPITLLYLFWEPSNADAHPIFAEHRSEIAHFAASIGSDRRPQFVAMSYPELWRFWDTLSQPDWLADHVARLRARYELPA